MIDSWCIVGVKIYILKVYYLLGDRVSLCSPAWTETCYVEQSQIYGDHQSQSLGERASESLELELQMVLMWVLGAVLWKSSRHSYLLSHLSYTPTSLPFPLILAKTYL